MHRQHQTEVLTDGLQQLSQEMEKHYPGLELEYGGVAIPDFIYRNNVFKNIVEKAINATGLRNPKNAGLFLLYPTDYATMASTVTYESDNPTVDSLNFDALIITNTSSFLSASWYQFSFIQYSIGQVTVPKIDFPALSSRDASKVAAIKNTKARAKPDLSRIRAFVTSKEDMYKKRVGHGKRLMTGYSRLL